MRGSNLSKSVQKKYRYDNKWSIAFVTFGRNYSKHKIGLIGLAILFTYLGMAIFSPYLVQYDPSPYNKVAPAFLAPSWMSIFDPQGIVSGEYLPDPNFRNPTQFTVEYNGSSTYGVGSGFSHEYISPSETDLNGHVRLTWTHLPNDLPHFVTPQSSDYPECADFVYVYQTFTWPWNAKPKDVNITIQYAMTFTGSFATETYAGRMFKVYVWLIDSSNEWTMAYNSVPPYSNESLYRVADLNILEINGGWDGMV